jgi:hypothetical protein
MHAAASKRRARNTWRVSHFSFVNFAFPPIPQTKLWVSSGDSNSSISITAQNQTPVLISFFLTIKDFHLAKFLPFSLNHPIYICYSTALFQKPLRMRHLFLWTFSSQLKMFTSKNIYLSSWFTLYIPTLADSSQIIYCLFWWSWSDHIAVCHSSSDRISSSILESHRRPLYRFIDWLSTCFIAPVIPSAVVTAPSLGRCRFSEGTSVWYWALHDSTRHVEQNMTVGITCDNKLKAIHHS